MAQDNNPPASSGAGQQVSYEEWAQRYLRSLTMENFMEATPQATQRKITLESLDLVCARRKDIHLFNELLVQWPREGKQRPGQVVPDNMVVIHDGEIQAVGSYDIPNQPARPFWVMEYVSKGSQRKDYEENFEKYEKHLRAPYYLTFYPEIQDLTLYRLNEQGRYQAVEADDNDRFPVPALEMEVGLLDGWARFWFRGELLPLPADLLRDLDQARSELEQSRQELTRSRAELTQSRAELTRSQAELERERARAAELERELQRLRAQSGGTAPPAAG